MEAMLLTGSTGRIGSNLVKFDSAVDRSSDNFNGLRFIYLVTKGIGTKTHS
jgi:hypothetical protein